MPTTIPAHLMLQGHAATLGNILSYTEVWISHNLRPDLSSSEYLPDIGDTITSTNVISSQSIMWNYLSACQCKTITEQEYIEGRSRGTIYTVQYDNQPDTAVYEEPTQDPDNVILSISSSAQVDTYTRDPEDTTLQKYYFEENGTRKEYKNTSISKITCLTSVSTTKRYRNKTPQEIIGMGTDTGKTNTSSMWGCAPGCILYNGLAATPIQEVVNDLVAINWNVTNNYTIKYIPGTALNNAPTWDMVFVNGVYSVLYTAPTGNTILPLYPRGSIPDDLS